MKDRLRRTNARKASHRLKRTCFGISFFAVAFSAIAITLLLSYANEKKDAEPAVVYTLRADGDKDDPTLQQGR